MNSFKGKKILLCVTGSIAAFKTCELIRILKKEGANIQVMMSSSAEKFIGSSTFAALSGEKVLTNLFPNSPIGGLEHIEMAFEIDLIVVVPATANIICKVASGIADDIISTTLSVCEQPLLFAPAMNNRMWSNQATQNAINQLKKMGKIVMEPEDGQLASLHTGKGRLPAIKSIIFEIRKLFDYPQPLKNKNILVTAGPTRENIDPVRFISNRSSGKMGYAIAHESYKMGGNVILISGPTSLNIPTGVNSINVENANEMHNQVLKYCNDADYIFMTAAISDYKIKNFSKFKIKKNKNNISINLKKNPDILKSLNGKTKAKIIAFALETNNGKNNALIKLKNKNADFIVLNYANEDGAGFESDTNRVTVFSKNKTFINLKKDRKDRISNKLIKFVLKNK
tara:strand:- start:4621 stop:5814 length:1194 start_codon:yes stop_codon:yes gene_type:complete